MSEGDESVSVVLRFLNRAQRDVFLGGLSDGWGEAHCELYWPIGTDFYENEEFDVTVPESEMRARRRGELIDLKWQRGLTPDETQELAAIEAKAYGEGEEEE